MLYATSKEVDEFLKRSEKKCKRINKVIRKALLDPDYYCDKCKLTMTLGTSTMGGSCFQCNGPVRKKITAKDIKAMIQFELRKDGA